MRALVVCLMAVAGCGGEQLVDDTFSEAEWAHLQTFRIDRLEPITCPDDPVTCEAMARFGQQLFFDPRLAGPLLIDSELGTAGDPANISCSTCHDPLRYFTDPRQPNGLSLGTKWTKRNVPGLVDLVYQQSFSWIGEYPSLTDVLELALRAGLNTNAKGLVATVLEHHLATYNAIFPDVIPGNPIPPHLETIIYANAARSITAYESKLVSGPSPFDRYLAEEATLDDAAKRGARLFIGKALCSECHSGPTFSDGGFYVTGVEQRGENVIAVDEGRALVTSLVGDLGKFRTPALRHVARTAPYMHTGQLQTLTEVIEFYRWGGDAGGFSGIKDPRMVPLDLTNEDVHDLEAFLLTLTGPPVAATWTTKPAVCGDAPCGTQELE